MALTALERRVCRLLAEERRRIGESYVAGGSALNELLGERRLSRDLDLFHDTAAALRSTWPRDRALLTAAGLTVEPLREAQAFVEALVRDGTETVLVQWLQDSAYRFFPLVEHEIFGLTLHPLDLATNKLLALAGRREPRDWIDAVACHEKVQPLGYLAWAASGKDPGLGPLALVEEAARTRYSAVELALLDFGGAPPDAASLSARWRQAVREARELVRLLPEDEVGRCVLDEDGALQRAAPGQLVEDLASGRVSFHRGRIGGAFPEVRATGPGRQ